MAQNNLLRSDAFLCGPLGKRSYAIACVVDCVASEDTTAIAELMIDPAGNVVIPVFIRRGIQIVEGTARRNIRQRLELIQEFPRNRIDSARRNSVVEKWPSLSRNRIDAERIVDGIASAKIAAPNCAIGNEVSRSLGCPSA